jgi:hypothetical protein
MIFVTICFFIATLLIGGSKAVQGEVLPGLAFIAAGLFAYWAGSALKLAVFAPASTPRRVGFIMAACLTLIGFAVTLWTGVRFDAYGQDMPGVAWVLAGLIAGIMGTKKRRYIMPPPQAPQI